MFTRQPDYFDSEQTQGVIVQQNNKFVAQFLENDSLHYAEVPYKFLHKKGEKIQVIYETADPAKAKQYAILGYWITFGELIVSIFIIMVLYLVAVSITNNPSPEALLEELEASKKKPRKPKYDL